MLMYHHRSGRCHRCMLRDLSTAVLLPSSSALFRRRCQSPGMKTDEKKLANRDRAWRVSHPYHLKRGRCIPWAFLSSVLGTNPQHARTVWQVFFPFTRTNFVPTQELKQVLNCTVTLLHTTVVSGTLSQMMTVRNEFRTIWEATRNYPLLLC